MFGNDEHLVCFEGEVISCARFVGGGLAGLFFSVGGREELCFACISKCAVDVYRLILGVYEHISVFACYLSAKAGDTSVRGIDIDLKALLVSVEGGDESRCGREFLAEACTVQIGEAAILHNTYLYSALFQRSEDAAHLVRQLHGWQDEIFVFCAVLALKSAAFNGEAGNDLKIGKIKVYLRVTELVHNSVETVFACIFFFGEVAKAPMVGSFVVHHKGLDWVAEENVGTVIACHDISEESDGAVVFFVALFFKKRFGIVGGENINSEGILKRD